jgi:ATP-binding cassette subfamily B protein
MEQICTARRDSAVKEKMCDMPVSADLLREGAAGMTESLSVKRIFFEGSQVFSDIKLMLGFIWKSDKSIFVFKGIVVILSVFYTIVNKLTFKWFLDSIQTKTLRYSLFLAVVVQLISFLLFSVTHLLENRKIPRSEFKLRNHLQNEFIKKAIKQDLERYENPKYYDNLARSLREADSKAIDFMNIFADILRQLFVMAAMIGIIISLDSVLLGFTVVLMLITFYDSVQSGILSYEHYDAEQSINRRAEYIKRTAHHRQFAIEVRMFNLGSFLLHKLNKTFIKKFKEYNRWHTKYWNHKYTVSSINTAINMIMKGYLVFQVFNKHISIGDFSALFGICFAITDEFLNVVDKVSRLYFGFFRPSCEESGNEVKLGNGYQGTIRRAA